MRQLAWWAVILGVAAIWEAAWRKRVQQCGDWLQWLLTQVLAQALRSPEPAGGPSRSRVLLVEGTSLGQTGGTGDDWRVQLASDLLEGRLVDVQIGDLLVAETLVGMPGRPGDLFVGDRGYGKRDTGIALAGMQAAALLRFWATHCRLEQAAGRLFEVSRWLEGLEEVVQSGEQEGSCVQGRERGKVRVLALRLPPEEAEQARHRVLARAKRKKQASRPETVQLAGWILVRSTWDAHDFCAEELFWVERHRWQIELLIKQMNQFLLLVRRRSRPPETVRATF